MVKHADRGSAAATLVFAAALLLVLGYAPAWCVAVGLACVAWRLLTLSGHVKRPRPRRGIRFLMGAITALMVIAVAMSFQTLNGLAAGTALLIVMGALKVVESRSRRDDAIVVAVALFLLLAGALAEQALWRAPFYLLAIWGAGASFALIAHAGSALTTRAALKLSARALAMSVPLAVACFAFFPRVSGQFWSLQRGEMASTGLSDEMSPGKIQELATEYDLAFRARFESTPPARTALYWRGPVLHDFDGFTWRRGRANYREPRLEFLGEPLRYRITLEPTNRPWILTLDTVTESPRRGMSVSFDRQVTANEPITRVTSYDAVSHLATRSLAALHPKAKDFETRLPADRNPRARALALEMRARSDSDTEFSRAVLDWFARNGLEYTLEPGVTTIDSVDTTLFDSKKGFCGHFASAYATMMRAGGVPARIVTGYLGGEWNPTGGYYIVRQSEAHAWTEIWLEGQGWTRVDPTAVVAPERLLRGVFDLLAESLPATSTFVHNSPLLRRLSQLWDGVNQWWQSNVVEFNLRAQLDLLNKLGIDAARWTHLGWAFAAGITLWIVWVALTLRRSVARDKPDRIARAWLRVTRKLEKIAAPRAASEGPLDFARRIASQRPELAASVTALAERYARLRFGPTPDTTQIAEFEREVSRLAA